MTTDRPTTDD